MTHLYLHKLSSVASKLNALDALATDVAVLKAQARLNGPIELRNVLKAVSLALEFEAKSRPTNNPRGPNAFGYKNSSSTSARDQRNPPATSQNTSSLVQCKTSTFSLLEIANDSEQLVEREADDDGNEYDGDINQQDMAEISFHAILRKTSEKYKLQGVPSVTKTDVSLQSYSTLPTATSKAPPTQVIPGIQSLLSAYQDVFVEVNTLPPNRAQTHSITLLPNSTPPNIRPYHYPYDQKTQIESQITLDLLRNNKFFANAKNCAFGERKIQFLGHVVSKYGVAVDSEKVQAVLNWSLPRDAKELKLDLTTVPVLRLLNFHEPFTVECDASSAGVGAILLQSEHPIAFFSKGLSFSNRLKSTYDRELLALLRLVSNMKLFPFDLTIIYKSGKENQGADVLSRRLQHADFMALVLPGCENSCTKLHGMSTNSTGLLQPLPSVWEDISLDFIVGLPKSGGVDMILVVVDRLSKYSHFLPLAHPFTAKSVAVLFCKEIVRLHGYHTSSETTPFKSLYGRDPPALNPYVKGKTLNANLEDQLMARDDALQLLRSNLLKAQCHMKAQTSSKRRELSFEVRDVYTVILWVGAVAYEHALPEDSKVHPIVLVSLLRAAHGQLVSQPPAPLPINAD
ncbi:retrotransposon polyprotein [Tanacetum coccineum]